MRQVDELIESDETFLTLDSLDEEAADSDESGYVEAPPKSLLGQEDVKDSVEKYEDSSVEMTDGADDDTTKTPMTTTTTIEDQNELSRTDNGPQDEKKPMTPLDRCNQHQDTEETTTNNNQKFKDREKVDFIKGPISETIKKLANASLRSSKSLEISTSTCLKALNNLKSSKSFDSSRSNVEHDEESPSLHQRKQLLAQHGVTV